MTKDAQDPRLRDFTQTDGDLKKGWALLGYPDDEGIRMNGGRPGAALAPYTIRKYLLKMTPAESLHENILLDQGNIDLSRPLAERHQLGRQLVTKNLLGGLKQISLGGGHDYGFADAAGFLDYALAKNKSKKPLILNFDAHLDVRPLDKGFNSGTPFRRLLEEFPEQFDFIELGLQPQCNSIQHRAWAQAKGAVLIDLSRIDSFGLLQILQNAFEVDADRLLWISLDMDVFSSSFAPGCSQSFATGLGPKEFLPSLDYLVQNFDCKGLGIYETSPLLDWDDHTSKLAALCVHRAIFAAQIKG